MMNQSRNLGESNQRSKRKTPGLVGTWKGSEESRGGGGNDLLDLVPTGKSAKIRTVHFI